MPSSLILQKVSNIITQKLGRQDQSHILFMKFYLDLRMFVGLGKNEKRFLPNVWFFIVIHHGIESVKKSPTVPSCTASVAEPKHKKKVTPRLQV